jgi:hypothetical protein
MKMVSLVRFPWMIGGLQACRKLQTWGKGGQEEPGQRAWERWGAAGRAHGLAQALT